MHKRYLLLLPILAVLAYGTVYATHKTPAPVVLTTPSVVAAPVMNLEEVAALVNKDRTSNNLPVLTRDPNLDASATDKCNDMITKDYWAHIAPDGANWRNMVLNHEKYLYAGENLAEGFTTANDVNTGWMNSPGHRANILASRYTEVGYALCQVPGYPNTVVQHFVGN